MRPEAVAPPPPKDCCSAYVAAVLGCYVAFVSPFAFAVALHYRENGSKNEPKWGQNGPKGRHGEAKGNTKTENRIRLPPEEVFGAFLDPFG